MASGVYLRLNHVENNESTAFWILSRVWVIQQTHHTNAGLSHQDGKQVLLIYHFFDEKHRNQPLLPAYKGGGPSPPRKYALYTGPKSQY